MHISNIGNGQAKKTFTTENGGTNGPTQEQ
jgi:hypothetical protein